MEQTIVTYGDHVVMELDKLTELARGPNLIDGNVGVMMTIDRRVTAVRPRSVSIWIGVARGINHTVIASNVHSAVGKARRWIGDFWKAELSS